MVKWKKTRRKRFFSVWEFIAQLPNTRPSSYFVLVFMVDQSSSGKNMSCEVLSVRAVTSGCREKGVVPKKSHFWGHFWSARYPIGKAPKSFSHTLSLFRVQWLGVWLDWRRSYICNSLTRWFSFTKKIKNAYLRPLSTKSVPPTTWNPWDVLEFRRVAVKRAMSGVREISGFWEKGVVPKTLFPSLSPRPEVVIFTEKSAKIRDVGLRQMCKFQECIG